MADDPTVSDSALPECFVMMPFSDVDGYPPGHFARIYRDVIKPACQKAGFRARRVDDEAETGMIHLDIIRSIVNAPMAICDLTAHRGNVLFELGMRQAFDKPVVLIQDERTGRLFDISGLRTTPYHSSLIYSDVLADQEVIALALRKTDEKTKSGEAVNSIVSLLSIAKADLKNVDKVDAGELIKLMREEMESLRRDVRSVSSRESLANRKSAGARRRALDHPQQTYLGLHREVFGLMAKGRESDLEDVLDDAFSTQRGVTVRHLREVNGLYIFEVTSMTPIRMEYLTQACEVHKIGLLDEPALRALDAG